MCVHRKNIPLIDSIFLFDPMEGIDFYYLFVTLGITAAAAAERGCSGQSRVVIICDVVITEIFFSIFLSSQRFLYCLPCVRGETLLRGLIIVGGYSPVPLQ